MKIHTSKVKSVIQRYRASELPASKPQHIESPERNLVDHFEATRNEVASDDNGPLDSDPAAGRVKYEQGNRIGFAYEYSDNAMTSSIEGKAYSSVEEFKFSDAGIERVSASHDSTGKPSAGSLTVDQIAPDGTSLERQTWWLDVDPKFEALFSPAVNT